MVNLMPVEPRPTDNEFRAWLLDRLDFLRSLVESGADAMIADSDFVGHDGRRVRVAAFHFFDDEWIAYHRARRAAGSSVPPPR